jgi:hypothetical protein
MATPGTEEILANDAEQRVGRWRGWRPGVAVVILVLVIGVGGGLWVAAGNGPDESSPLATYPPPRTGKVALASGRVVLEGGCVYLASETADRTVLLFPRETQWDPSSRQIHLGNSTVRIGELVSAGGGFSPASDADYVPSGCQYDASAAMPFYQLSDIRPGVPK